MTEYSDRKNNQLNQIQSESQRDRFVKLNVFRHKIRQQTKALLESTIQGESHDSKASEAQKNLSSIEETMRVRDTLASVFIKHFPAFAKMVVVYFIIAILNAILTVTIGQAIANYLVYKDLPTILQLAFYLIAIAISVGVLNFIRTIIFAKYEISTIHQVQSIIMKRLFNLPVSFFEQYATGDLCHRVLMIEPLARLSGQNQIGVLLSFAFATISFLAMFYFCWQLTLITLAIVSIYLIASLSTIKKQLPQIEKYMSYSGDTAAFTFNMNSGMSRIRVFCSEVFAEATWAKLYCNMRQMLSQIYRLGIRRFTITNNILLFTLVIVFFFATQLDRHQLPIKNYIIFYTAFIQFMSALVSFSMQLNDIAFSICAFRRIKPILNAATESSSTIQSSPELSGALTLTNVQFAYPRSKLPILNGLTCSIAKGEHVAIVGLSGAGKSTLLKLLFGFYFPQQGHISFDDYPIQRIDLSALRRQIGVVFQDSKLMSGTLLTNIIDGHAGMTEDDAWRAAELVGIKEFIASLPMKMNTLVSQQLNVLSGGQKQLILIARALVGKPRLLLLDEATNSLDATAHHHIAKIISNLPITCISIAHRLSTIQYADRIMVLDKGLITEDGTYEQLLQSKGLFYRLAEQQERSSTITQKLHREWKEATTI